MHEWEQVQVNEFAFNGSVFAWDSKQEMSFQGVELRLMLAGFLPALILILLVVQWEMWNPHSGRCRPSCCRRKRGVQDSSQPSPTDGDD